MDSYSQKWFHFEFWHRVYYSYIQANPDMVSQERCRDSSVSRWKRKTLSAWIETKDLPLDYSINIPLSDLKIYLAVALGFLSQK